MSAVPPFGIQTISQKIALRFFGFFNSTWLYIRELVFGW
ncbi:hypothetical protein APA_2020 [Pseudanabaena sp. lw0831]|nr:hypothetical protein APA_2020 [Pseudanabaena sp. lw0831]